MKRSRIILSTMLAVVLVSTTVFSTVAFGSESGVTPAAPSNGSPAPTGTAVALQTAVPTAKDEIVYANLASTGKVNDINVVNEFDVTTAGSLTDYGSYSSVQNLTTTDAVSQDGDTVTAPVQPGEFYYSGTLASNSLPWNYALTYYLDGTQIGAKDLAGKSGKLEIRLTSSQNPAVNSAFYNNYMQQISMTLDAENSSDITAEGATIANSGKDKLLTFTVMPEKDADISVKAQVKDFTMDGIQIAALPFSMGMDLPDTSGMVGRMTPLTDAIAQIDAGVGQLADGARALSDGAAKLEEGSSQFNDGIKQADAGSPDLLKGSAQIKKALTDISSSMGAGTGSASGIDVSSFSKLPKALTDMAGGLTAVSGALTKLNTGYTTAYNSLDGAIAALPATPVDPSALMKLVTPGSPEEASLNQLLAYYQGALVVRGTYFGPGGTGSDGAKAAFASVGPTIATLTDPASQSSLAGLSGALTAMATQIETAMKTMDTSGLEKLAAGLKTLSEEYDKFDQGLKAYSGGVSAMASNYSELDRGLASLSDGLAQNADGTQQLHEGTTRLNSETATLPDTMQVEIDSMMSQFDKSDFTPVSFVSPKNTGVELVQFVITTEGVAKEKAPAAAEQAAPDPTPWDQFLNLFR